MKLNWGQRLFIFTGLFMVFISGLVWYMLRQDVQLVDSDYYEKGIRYQEAIDARNAADKLMMMGMDTIDEVGPAIVIRSLDSTAGTISGVLNFYRPSDKTKDFKVQVELPSGTQFSHPLNGLDAGLWRLSLEWTDTNGNHLLEQSITI